MPSQFNYLVADSMSPVGLYTEVNIEKGRLNKPNEIAAIGFEKGMLGFETSNGKLRNVVFRLKDPAIVKPDTSIHLKASGHNVMARNNSVYWNYPWKENIQYKFFLHLLRDSASSTTIYTGYIFIPELLQWKFLASFQAHDNGTSIKEWSSGAAFKKSASAADLPEVNFSNQWLLRKGDQWLSASTQPGTNEKPVVDVTKNLDSLVQAGKDRAEIFAAIKKGTVDTSGSKDGLYYLMLKQGTGPQVAVNDTVTANAKGWLLKDGSVFYQTKDKPDTFPLNRLIRGWQIGVPLLQVGGSIRVIVPSGLAYSIRSRSKDIPPNSILVFDIEIVAARK